jgi:hypothetical protein
MSNASLRLVPIVDRIKELVPAAMHEHAAAKYLGMNRTSFRSLVFAGIIPYAVHLHGKRRIYLRSDLDRYLESLPRSTMVPRENSPLVALKGAAK